MGKNNKYWDYLGEYYFWTRIGYKVLIPVIIILIIIIILVVQLIYGAGYSSKYGNDKSVILDTKLEKTVYDYAKNGYDKNVFSNVELEKNNNFYSVEINYTFKGENKSASEYDSLAKTEYTRLYNLLKDKKIIDDHIFGDGTINRSNIELTFLYPTSADTIFNFLGGAGIEYEDNKFSEETYQKEISSVIIKDKNLQEVLEKIESHKDG